MSAYSAAVTEALLNQWGVMFPAGSKLELRTGEPSITPAGTLLVEIVLPKSPWAAASSRTKEKSGTWAAKAVAAGSIGHYRLVNGLHVEAGGVGPKGELVVDSTTVAVSQPVVVMSFTKEM